MTIETAEWHKRHCLLVRWVLKCLRIVTCPRKGTDNGLGHTGYLATSDCNGKMFIPQLVGHKLFYFIFIYTHKTWKHRPETEAIHPSDSCTLSWNQHISAPFTFVGECYQFLFCVTLFIATAWWVVCKSLQTGQYLPCNPEKPASDQTNHK